MLSVTANTLKPISPFTQNKLLFLNPPQFTSLKPFSKPISATLIPSSKPQQQKQFYQPFRPPSSPLPPQYRSLDTAARIDVLANRLGLWFEYAPLIPSLYQEGFTAPIIEEATGISGVEQNRLVVAAQVRDTLVQANLEPEILFFYDLGGAEILYEIRLLSTGQRVAAARYLAKCKADPKRANELARAIKDFPRRRGDPGWDKFNYVIPADCLAFMYYRQSREHDNPSEERTSFLELALSVAESDDAKRVLENELKGENVGKEEEGGIRDGVRVPVVRMKFGEVSEASNVVVLPVCKGDEGEKEVLEAPWECKSAGDFGVVVAEKGWKSWVVLPGWDPIYGLENGGVVVSFSDARVLPWKANRWYKEESILVVADRGRKEVAADDGFYMVMVDGGGLKVERGSTLKERGVDECLGTVLLVVRPPREDNDDAFAEEDWE